MFLGKVENYNIWILNIVVNICDIKYLTASIKYSTRLGLLDTEQECERERLCLRVLDQMWTSTVCECIIIDIMDQHLYMLMSENYDAHIVWLNTTHTL